jgi:hypothetical protein
LDKKTGAKTNDAGAGWLNDNGTVSIVLGPATALSYNKNLVITLFPLKDKEETPST